MNTERGNVKITDIYGPGKFGLSFELFPPKTEESEKELFNNLDDLVAFEPDYITCTYGAGGSTRDKTLDIVSEVKKRYKTPVAAHLTCVGATTDDIRAFLREATERDVDAIMALRGDPPKGEKEFKPVEGGLNYANELVALIRAEFPHFGIAVAGYPEVHQEAPDALADLDALKRKVDAGAEVVVTQFFFDNENFFRFREWCETAGINVPIVPGVLPVTNSKMIKRIAKLCGAQLPQDFLDRLEAHNEDPQGQFDVGVYYATRQVEELVESGVPGIHFYVLNKSKATATLLRALTLPQRAAELAED